MVNMSSIGLKFVCKDELASSLEKSIQDLKNNSQFYPDSSFHPSQITECPRRIIYRVRGDLKDGTSLFNSIDSEHFKNKWISILEKIKFVKVLHKDVIASDCNYNLYEKVDSVINIGGDIFAVNAISVNNDDMVKIIKNGAIKKHVVAMAVYVWLLEINGGFLIYENEKKDFYIFHIKPYKPIIDSVIDKCNKLCDFKLKGKIPNRPYETKAKECTCDCEFETLCWGNNEDDKQ